MAKWSVVLIRLMMAWVRILAGIQAILPVIILPAGLARRRNVAVHGLPCLHRDMHAGVNRNPSQDHGWLVRTELWPTTYFQAEFHESTNK